MNPRERLQQTLNHIQPDRVCIDFGSGGQTGMGAGAVSRLRRTVLGDHNYRVKIIEPYQMLGEVDEQLRNALSVDVAGINTPSNIFGFPNCGWKPFDMPDGTPVMVPEKFNYTRSQDGTLYIYPQGDLSARPSGRMPAGGYYFDAVIRQEPVDEKKLNPQDNCEEFAVLSEADIEYYKSAVEDLYQNTDYGIYVTLPGMAFGDPALVPATWLKNPKGIRDIEEWYMSTALRPDYIHSVFEKQCEIALANVELLAGSLGDMPQVVFTSGTDFGTQRGLFCSLDTYRSLYKPYQKAINDKIHSLTNWKVFMHCCGSIRELIPDIIDAGFDILNPVQTSAAGMDASELKREFGNDLVFWGGGVDTQTILPFGTPEDVYREVMGKVEIFNEDGGYVFTSIHNIQGNVPLENILAVFKALKDCGVEGLDIR
jgi:uroporphyrinogen-III decarboxylase